MFIEAKLGEDPIETTLGCLWHASILAEFQRKTAGDTKHPGMDYS